MATAAAAAASSRKRPAPEGVRPPAMLSSSREHPAPEGARRSASSSSSCKSPAPEGAHPAATASSRKRPAPGEEHPAVTAARKRARFKFSKIADYEMVKKLGEGAYGVVFKARHRRTGETVAIKWMRSVGAGGPDLDAFVREGACMGACRGNPSVVQIKDIASDEATGDLFLVMEFVGGSCLRDWVWRPVSEDVTRRYMGQLLSAAAKMHSSPMALIHRDIKPENILVGIFGELKVCDFGSATPVKPQGTPYPEERVGTLIYCSPEQLKGSRCYGTAVDMWALGCVMVELLIGAPLFSATNEEEMLLRIKDLYEGIAAVGTKAIDELLELSPAGLDLLTGLLRIEPGERITAAEALSHRWFTEAAAGPATAAKGMFPGFVSGKA